MTDTPRKPVERPKPSHPGDKQKGAGKLPGIQEYEQTKPGTGKPPKSRPPQR